MGILFLKDVPGASSIVITDTTTQDELNVHMVTLGVTYKTVAYFLMVGVVMHNKLNMGTANKELSLISYEQAHVFWFFVKEVLVDFSEKALSEKQNATSTATCKCQLRTATIKTRFKPS